MKTELDPVERTIADLMLAQLRVRDPLLGDDDLTRPIADLDLDSLDNLELVHLLERELRVRADLEQVAGFGQLYDFLPYFSALASQG